MYIMVHALVVVIVVVLVQDKLFVTAKEGEGNHGNTEPGESILESVDPSKLAFVAPSVSRWLVLAQRLLETLR